ncbi:hypothetical protein E8E15_009224 [Penicillium rubens]|uniref:Ubiquitin-conjugating enzyme E2 1 n=2 Tax=Penicillium chrysogenum species complex TaxID=254878 RepID=A0A167W010_PENCH|nr:hypothetical protein E8E15_009224 [Penicillium rubens]KZN91101.1 Ubiquitin-conjugating enzyme E2 [Penicillium chrysogenum]
MASNRMRRIGKEIADIHADAHSQIKAEPFGNQDDVTHLRGSFPGPPGTPYEGGTYNIDIKIPTDYPFRPPTMKFETKVWHPNVSSQTGAICLDTLSTAWSPVLTIKSALLSLQSLLSTPEPKDPQDAEVANMLLKSPKEFERVARDWAVVYAGAPASADNGSGSSIDDTRQGAGEDSLAKYDGYNKNLIDRFSSMGFDVDRVVAAFRHVGVERRGGQDYELEENSMGEIAARLLGIKVSSLPFFQQVKGTNTMIEDDIYRASSQYRLWSYTEPSLQSLRATTNAVASERVRAALRRSCEAHQSTATSAAGTPLPESNMEVKNKDEKDVECLTPEEELVLVRYYCEKTLELGETYKPPIPTMVRATAIQYLRRFYLTNSPMTYHPKSIMACALFVATKTDNYYISLRQFADGIPGDTTTEDVIAPEFLLMQGLRFTFDVRHPFRGLEGGVLELQAIAQGQGQPAPHLPYETAEDLQQGLLSIAPPPVPSSSMSDRIARAHGTTRELLKSAAQMTDAYFLYTPSQIWFSAFLLADRPLAEFLLDVKLGGPVTATIPAPETDENGLVNPLYEIRSKLHHVLTECSALLQSYTPLSSDPAQMKSLKRIAKKLYHCQNPEKVNLAAAQKRESTQPSTAVQSDAGIVTSESETERLAKKRKLEQEQKVRQEDDVFGPELVTQRTKQ